VGAELVDEVRLVVIAAVLRERRPADAGGVFDPDECPAEALQPLVGLGRDADVGAEDLLEPALREPERFAQLGDPAAHRGCLDASGGAPGGGMRRSRGPRQSCGQHPLGRLELRLGGGCLEHALAQLRCAGTPELGQRHVQVAQLVEREPHQGAGAADLERHAQRVALLRGVQDERVREWAGHHHGRVVAEAYHEIHTARRQAPIARMTRCLALVEPDRLHEPGQRPARRGGDIHTGQASRGGGDD
jgi:hypothetical protein